jgi:hypothetical protein
MRAALEVKGERLNEDLKRLEVKGERLNEELKRLQAEEEAERAATEAATAPPVEPPREPERPTNPPSQNTPMADLPLWEFAIGRFRYKTEDWHNLTGQGFHLLQAFAEAKHCTLTHDQIRTVCSPGYTATREHSYVSELNQKLCKIWKAKENPIRPIRGEKAYQLCPP